MTPLSRWKIAARTAAVLAALSTVFTVGWALAQLLFHLTGRPPALFAFLIAAVLSLAVGGAAAALFARVTGRGDRHLFDKLRAALERIAQGDFDVHLEVTQPGPFSEVIATINEMAHNLGTLEEQRQTFVSNVSHEIQSPLTSIGGFADLLRDPGLDEPTRQRYLDIISTECRRLSGLSENLLRLSSLDDARLERSRFRLDEHLRGVVLALEPVWSASAVQVELAAEPLWVQADAELLQQVWTNLVQNAVKFTAPEGRVEVRVTAEPTGAAQVQVHDTGVGISAVDLPHVFERFYRVDKARGPGGNGLGLALAKRIVDLHHGRITVASDPGRGSTFTVVLPPFTSR